MCDRDNCNRPNAYKVEEDNPFAHRVFILCKEHYESRKNDIWKGWKVTSLSSGKPTGEQP
jgi:hypothetical protein